MENKILEKRLIEILTDLLVDNDCSCYIGRTVAVEKILDIFEEENHKLKLEIFRLNEELSNWLK